MLPSGAGSTVRIRPNVPLKFDVTLVRLLPLITSRYRRAPRSQATYRMLRMMVMPLQEPDPTGYVCLGAISPAPPQEPDVPSHPGQP